MIFDVIKYECSALSEEIEQVARQSGEVGTTVKTHTTQQ